MKKYRHYFFGLFFICLALSSGWYYYSASNYRSVASEQFSVEQFWIRCDSQAIVGKSMYSASVLMPAKRTDFVDGKHFRNITKGRKPVSSLKIVLDRENKSVSIVELHPYLFRPGKRFEYLQEVEHPTEVKNSSTLPTVASAVMTQDLSELLQGNIRYIESEEKVEILTEIDGKKRQEARISIKCTVVDKDIEIARALNQLN